MFSDITNTAVYADEFLNIFDNSLFFENYDCYLFSSDPWLRPIN
jgi:hypothetical protein